MSTPNLHERVEVLETEVRKLRRQLAATRKPPTKDWRKTIGAFTEDEGLRTILQEAMRLRTADRKKTGRGTRGKSRK